MSWASEEWGDGADVAVPGKVNPPCDVWTWLMLMGPSQVHVLREGIMSTVEKCKLVVPN